jgi:LuxR family maltose regulon positive regulatory protein
MIETVLPLDIPHIAVPAGPLLTTKLYAPRLRTNRVVRPWLITRLNQGLEQRKLTLISAPTGSGKTTLMSEWLYSKAEVETQSGEYGVSSVFPTAYSLLPTPLKVAWLSLDRDDNDPVRFLTYVIAALQIIWPDLGETSLNVLHSSRPLPLEAVLTALVNEIATIPTEFVFILDDYHVIETEIIHRALSFLLDNLPAQIHWVIISRVDPSFSLAHLRARGQLLELHAAELRFTPTEAAAFLNQVMGLNLSADDIDTLEARTEGWIAGLQLAALSMQGCEAEDIPSFMAAFGGSHRYILDYLAEEVLQRQPEAIQTFLLQTSILDRMCGPLCDAVIYENEEARRRGGEHKDQQHRLTASSPPRLTGQGMLEWLEQANLFIIPLDDERRWYRYHHLFADLLRNLLQKNVGAQGLAPLHRRAAEWFERQGLPAEAMSHALAAADVERAARLVEQNARTLLSRSEMATLLSWLNALPAELVRSQPQLSLFQAWALTLTGQLDAVEPYLQGVERHEGEMAAIRATVAYFRRDMPQAIALYRQAFEKLPADNSFLRGAVALSLGIAYSWSGQVAEASQALSEASAISQTSGNLHVALTAGWNLAQLYLERGHLRRAIEHCQQALQFADEQAKQTEALLPPAAGGVYVSLGGLFYEQNDLAAAAHYLEEGIKLGEQGADLAILVIGYLTLARLKLAQVDPEGALKLTRQAEQLAQRYNSPYWVAQAAAAQARLWIAQGQSEEANRWAQAQKLDEADKLDYLGEVETITLARLLVAQGKLDQAVVLLGRLLEATEAGGRMGRVIEILALQALAYQAQGKADQAISILEQALALAEPEGYVRLFLDEGTSMIELLAAVRDRHPSGHRRSAVNQAYIDGLLAAYRKDQEKSLHHLPPVGGSALSPQPLIEPLSERELEILRLIATGRSNGEIAEALFVTVGTIKWHLNNIYGKLDVRSRTQAVARARELDLI